MRDLLGRELVCAVGMHGLHCKAAASWLRPAASIGQPREESYRVCRYGCCVSQERIKVSAIPKAPGVFFQPLSSCFAYPGSATSADSVNSKAIGVTNRIGRTTVLKPLAVWITANWKILKDMGLSDHLTCLLRKLYACQEATVRTGHGTINGSELGKKYIKAIYCHPVYLTYMQSRS